MAYEGINNEPKKCGYSELIGGGFYWCNDQNSAFYWCNDKNSVCRYTKCRFVKEGSDGSKHGEVREDS